MTKRSEETCVQRTVPTSARVAAVGLIVTCWLAVAPLAAQESRAAVGSSQPTASPPAVTKSSPATLKKNDITGTIGVFGANQDEVGSRYDHWYSSFYGALAYGRYWTDHWRTDVELSAARRGEIYGEQNIAVEGSPFPIFRFSEHYFQSSMLSVTQSYQFFRNAWFHPIVGIGLDVEREEELIEFPEQLVPIDGDFRRTNRLPAEEIGPEHAWHVSPTALIGFKAYVSSFVFVRSDIKVAVDDGWNRVVWRVGFGTDF